MTQITQIITTLPTAPARSQPSATFIANADAHVAALSTLTSEINTWRGQANTVAGEVNANAVAAAASEVAAAASSASASAAANVTKWISGTSYTQGDTVWSPIDFLTYRRKVTGGGTTDPSADSTNWQLLLAAGGTTWTTITADPAPAIAGAAYLCNTTSAAFTVTLPAAPSANDVVRIADYAGMFATNNLTVGRNALKIMGLAENMTVSTNNVSLTLTYLDATRGWQLT